MFGVSIRPPNGSIAEKPTSSSTMYRMFGAPSGAIGWVYGPQSGTESLMSMLTTPRNGSPMIPSQWIARNACYTRPEARP